MDDRCIHDMPLTQCRLCHKPIAERAEDGIEYDAFRKSVGNGRHKAQSDLIRATGTRVTIIDGKVVNTTHTGVVTDHRAIKAAIKDKPRKRTAGDSMGKPHKPRKKKRVISYPSCQTHFGRAIMTPKW